MFSVFNRGNQKLTLGTISLPEGFRVKEGLASMIRPGRSDTFTLELKTNLPGFKYGVLRFSNNDPNENPYEFAIAGQVTEASRGAPSVEVLCVSCGNEPVRDRFDRRFRDVAEIWLWHSCGNSACSIMATRISTWGHWRFPEGFRLIGRLSQTIRPGKSDDFMLAMKTNEAGMKSGVVRFASDAPNGDTFEFEVLGEVAQRGQPEVDVLLNGDPVRSGSVVGFGTALQGAPARSVFSRSSTTVSGR